VNTCEYKTVTLKHSKRFAVVDTAPHRSSVKVGFFLKVKTSSVYEAVPVIGSNRTIGLWSISPYTKRCLGQAYVYS
jgi:hypothetical protein